MFQLSVICPAAPWENESTNTDRAWDLCFDLSEEYGYAEVRRDGMIIGSYRNGSAVCPDELLALIKRSS